MDEKRRNYVKEYNQKRRVDAKSIKKTKSINQKRKKDKAENKKEIAKRSSKRLRQKQQQSNPETLKEYEKQKFMKRKAEKPEDIKQTNRKCKSRKKESAKNKENFMSVVNLFHNNIKCGPEYICTCCDQLWYSSSVVKCDAEKYKVC